MRAAVIGGDAVALGSVVGSLLHIFPTVIGGLAGFLGLVWYSIMIYDRFTTHVSSFDAEKYDREQFRRWHGRGEETSDGPGSSDRP